jgi:hypothetical protein
MGIMGVIGVISVICIIGIIIKKVARQKSDNLICESVDKMWNFKACEIRESGAYYAYVSISRRSVTPKLPF